LKNCALTD